jgi:radical SAM protein with 4Fe4S-binding SPASM domain
MVEENDIFVLNPLFRLRKEDGFVTVFGSHGTGNWPMHLSHAVVLALCNGHRTVSDIGRIARPLVAMDDENNAIQAAFHIVKDVIDWMAKTREEQRGEPAVPSYLPSRAALIKKEEFEATFGHVRYCRPRYDPHRFLPADASEVRTGPFKVIHYRSPLTVNWHLTSECTTDCRYCYLGRRNVKSLPKEKALTLVKELAEAEVCHVELSGGDVLLYAHLLEVLGELSRFQFPPVAIATKTFLSREMASELAQVVDVIAELQFSIDTDDEEIGKYLVGVRDYPNRVFSSIDNALEAGLFVAAKVVITPYNVLTVPRLYRKLRRCGVSEIRLAAYSRSGFHHSDDLYLNDHCYAWLEEEVRKLRVDFPGVHINIQNGLDTGPVSREMRKEAWAKRSSCTAGKSSMMICSDGKVIPCEQMPETEEYFCGDLTRHSLLEVWNGDRLKEMTYGMPRERFEGQPCYDCEEREECLNVMGTCIRDLAAHYGGIYRPSPNCYRHDLPSVRMS